MKPAAQKAEQLARAKAMTRRGTPAMSMERDLAIACPRHPSDGELCVTVFYGPEIDGWWLEDRPDHCDAAEHCEPWTLDEIAETTTRIDRAFGNWSTNQEEARDTGGESPSQLAALQDAGRTVA